jgi:hypothetical protein
VGAGQSAWGVVFVSRVNALTVKWGGVLRRPHLVAVEFVIDGRPLSEYCERATGETFDLSSPFGWTLLDHQLVLAQRLLLRQPPILLTGRREFLVCPECADLGCGCISAVVRSEKGFYIWSDFGYENEVDPGSLQLFPMGRFIFPEDEVAGVLSKVIPGLIDTLG